MYTLDLTKIKYMGGGFRHKILVHTQIVLTILGEHVSFKGSLHLGSNGHARSPIIHSIIKV